MYRVLIMADSALRDIPGLALVRAWLEKLNPDLNIVMADIHLLADSIELFKPHLILMPSLHDPARARMIDDVRRRGGLCVMLPSEGRANNDGLMRWVAQLWPSELCDLYCAWSPELFGALPAGLNKIVTGSPRFDFYFPPLNRLVDSKAIVCSKYGLNPNKSIVTVASSFPKAKFHGKAEFLLRDWKNLRMTEVEGQEDPEAYARFEYDGLRKFQSWVGTFAHENKGYQLLIKPHPAEGVQDWMKLADDIGASLMHMDYIYNMLAVSDVHVARVECTTLNEAWIVGKKTVAVWYGEKLSGQGADINSRNTAFAENYCEFELEVLECFEANTVPGRKPYDFEANSRAEYIPKWLGPMPDAGRRVADVILRLLLDKKPKTHREPTPEELVKLHILLENHSRQFTVPQADHLGQFAKSVRLADTDRWGTMTRETINEQGD